MKWYKHISDSLDDPFIFSLMEEFGSDGYLVFFGVIEIYSREFSPKDGWILTGKLSYFRHKLLMSCAKFKKIMSKITKWEVSYFGDTISIYIPKFRELLDESTLKKLREHGKSFRNDSGTIPKTKGTDVDKDGEEDKEKETTIVPATDNKQECKELKNEKNKIFIVPTVEEVATYCKERKNSIDPQYFVDSYTAKGWMVGKNKMKDWKASIRTWEKNNYGGVNGQHDGQNERSTAFRGERTTYSKKEGGGYGNRAGGLGIPNEYKPEPCPIVSEEQRRENLKRVKALIDG